MIFSDDVWWRFILVLTPLQQSQQQHIELSEFGENFITPIQRKKKLENLFWDCLKRLLIWVTKIYRETLMDFWRKKFTTMRLCYGLVVLKYLLINLLWHIRLIVKKIILSMSDRHELTFHKALNTINCFCGYFGLNHHCTRKIKGSITEAVVPRCSIKKVFLEILQNSEENTCARVPFLIKLQASGLQIY